MSNLLLSLPLLTRCATLVQKNTLYRVFSGLVKTCQPPKGKKCEIVNLELGKILQRNGYKAASHKLWGKTRIVVNFNPERLQLNQILVPYGGKDRSFCFFFGP